MKSLHVPPGRVVMTRRRTARHCITTLEPMDFHGRDACPSPPHQHRQSEPAALLTAAGHQAAGSVRTGFHHSRMLPVHPISPAALPPLGLGR